MTALLLGAAPAPPSNTLLTLDAQRQARAVDRDADRAGAQAAAAAIAGLRAKLIGLGRQESDGQRNVGGARAALTRLNLQEAELKVRMGRNEQSLTQLLGALQMYARNPPPPLLVDPRSARDAVRAAILIKAITPELETRAKAFSSQSEALKRVRRQADAQSGVLFQAESTLADREAQIADLNRPEAGPGEAALRRRRRRPGRRAALGRPRPLARRTRPRAGRTQPGRWWR